jgi:hypothetical protein
MSDQVNIDQPLGVPDCPGSGGIDLNTGFEVIAIEFSRKLSQFGFSFFKSAFSCLLILLCLGRA